MAKLFERRGRENRDVTVVPSNLWRAGSHGISTPTGLSITPDVAMTVTAFFSAVRFRANAVASLPKIIYQRTKAGKRRAAEHPLYGVLHDIPNPDMTAFDLWSTLDAHVMVRGNGYAEIVTDRAGNVVQLWPLRPDKMHVVRNEKDELRYVVTLPDKYGGEKRVLLPEQVLHLRGLSHDGIVGYAPITMMRNSVALAKATEEFGSAFFGNGAAPGVVLKHPAKLNDQKVYDRLKSSWEEAHMGLEQSHRVAILEEGMSVEKIGLSPEDSQFLQTRVHQVYEISRMTDVPPSMIFELSQSNYSTLEQMTLDFVVHHLRPWLVAYEQQCYRSLLMQSERDAGYFVENLIDGLLRGDLQTRYSAYSVGRQNGWLSINDIRRLENMNSIGTAGDKYIVPLNFSVLGEDGMPMPVQDVNAGGGNTAARSVGGGQLVVGSERLPVISDQLVVGSERLPVISDQLAEGGRQRAVAFLGTDRFFGDVAEPLLRDAAERIGKRELNEFTAAKRKFGNKPEKYAQWVNTFYEVEYPAFVRTVVQPLVDAGLVDEELVTASFEKYFIARRTLAHGDSLSVYVVDEIVMLFDELGEVDDG